MGEQATALSTKSKLAPEDDPKSELNVLRREVRQLQASVRDTALQMAVQQEQIHSLRSAVVSAETEVEEGLTREGRLRMQLEVQSLKKERVESTLAAAEKLVSALREMVLESNGNGSMSDSQQPFVPPPVLTNPVSPASDEKKLDLLLSRISDAEGKHSPVQSPTVYQQLSSDSVEETQRTDFETSIPRDTMTGGAYPISQPRSERPHRPYDDSDIPSRQSETLQSSEPPGMRAHRHSMPVGRSLANARPGRPHSNLLMSAFGPGLPPAASQVPTVRFTAAGAEDELPAEIAAIAKGDEITRKLEPTPLSLQLRIRSANSQAHSGDIFAIQSSIDGRLIASGGDDKLVRIYDSAGNSVGCGTGCIKSITALAFSPEANQQTADFDIICAGTSDGSIRRFRRNGKKRSKWNLGTVFPVHSQAVRQIMFTDEHGIPGSQQLILTCSTDRTIRMSDIENGHRPFSTITPSAVLDLSCFPAIRNGLIASGHKDGGVRLWSTADPSACVGGAEVHSKGVVSVWAVDDGNRVVSLGRDNSFRICDVRKNLSVIHEISGAVETVSDWHRAVLHRRHITCGSSRSGQLGVWNIDTMKLVRRVSSEEPDSPADVLDLVSRKLRNPGCVVVPHWTSLGQLVCAHHTRQVSFWDS